MMVPHHTPAVEMGELAEQRTAHADELVPLADPIIRTQQEEISLMNGLLGRAGVEPVDPAGDAGGMDHGGMAVDGMMTAEDMDALAAADGEIFDKLFLTMMIAHHTGAVGAAETVMEDGGDADFPYLARGIITAQQDEVEQMQGVAAGMGSVSRGPRTPGRLRAATALAVAGLAALPGCASPTDAAAVSAQDLVHVHGLAEDPAGDGIFVATHTGLFAVRGGEITRVTQMTHDLMGFTVAGPGDLLASGHPDFRDTELYSPDRTPLLGLVESSDGEQWASRSLLGETDFHTLEAEHRLVYGYDVTNVRFLVSEDRVEWDTRSEIGMLDFAVDPDDPDVIVATGMVQGGTTRSLDGGVSWAPLDSDQYAYVDWGPTGLYGITGDGRVGVSTDGGDRWSAGGSVGGQPEAILATPERLLVAVSDIGIVESTDGGDSFDVLVQTTP
jgi:uncharacterized protein (DUF305 family)